METVLKLARFHEDSFPRWLRKDCEARAKKLQQRADTEDGGKKKKRLVGETTGRL
jgi:hypothetical protein